MSYFAVFVAPIIYFEVSFDAIVCFSDYSAIATPRFLEIIFVLLVELATVMGKGTLCLTF